MKHTYWNKFLYMLSYCFGSDCSKQIDMDSQSNKEDKKQTFLKKTQSCSLLNNHTSHSYSTSKDKYYNINKGKSIIRKKLQWIIGDDYIN